MTANRPIEHLREAEKLTADALIDLYEIQLRTESATIRVKNDSPATYLGQFYEGFPIEITGESRSAEDEEARPRLRVMNPEGVFNSLVRQKLLDRATVIRRRVLLQHLEQDVAIFQQRMWYVSRISEVLAGQSVQMELRSMTEGPNFMIPARMYMPPSFPMVRLR